VLEKALQAGGTWRDNTYPGCACDVASHLYSFSFMQNPGWSRTFSAQPEIQRYILDSIAQLGLENLIRYGCEVTRIEFIPEAALWRLYQHGELLYTARTVVAALGPLNQPRYPEIDGLELFGGQMFHSATWQHDYPLHNKKIAVIGTGASAIQFIPRIAPQAEHLYVFQRSAPWIMPKADRPVRAWEKWIFANFPMVLHGYRHAIFWHNELRGLPFMGNKALQKLAKLMALRFLNQSVKDQELRSKLTPNYTIGCKRVLLSNDYYPAMQRSNVSLVCDRITAIDARGIISEKGIHYPVDAIVLGTGFAASEFKHQIEIVGLEGQHLRDVWQRHGMQAYKGTTIAGFPHLFFMIGPNTGGGHNSIVHIAESQAAYIESFLQFLDSIAPYAYLDVKAEAQSAYKQFIEQKLKSTVWYSGCSSWYLDKLGRNTTLFPGLNTHFRKLTRKFDKQAYHILTSVLQTEPVKV
jgi:cation diffusion facilitator CzcD-associated flavoprotein CzcO